MTELWVTMKNTARWQLTSSALHGFMGALSTAYGYSKALNRSLTDIRIVSGQSAEEMKEFAEQANKAAKTLNATTVDYTDAALIYYQQGLDQDAVEERTNATIKMANVTGETAQTVSDQMTAIWNNYDDGSKKLEYYADVITALGAATASSSGEIAQGLEKFSAIAGQVGLSYEYATSALATVTATTRESADVVGTAFKTLFARIQGLSLGETMDDGTNLNKYSEALQKVGISIFEQNGELKAMDKILDEMGSKWDTLSNAQQVALAQTVAGVRQYNQLMTLMGHWDFFKENLAVAQGSEGELQKQADIYAESWEAARDRVRASAEDIYDSIINPDLFIELDNTLTPILSTVADLIDGMGGLEGAATIAAYAFTKLYGPQIQEGLRKTYDNIRLLTGAAQATSRDRQAEAVDLASDLPVAYTADKSLQTKLHLMKQEVNLQGTLNKYADSLSKEYIEQVGYKQQAIDLLKQEAIAQAEKITQLKQSITELRGDIFIDVHLKSGWKRTLSEQLNLNDTELRNLFGFKDNAEFAAMGNDADKAVRQLTKSLGRLTQERSNMDILKSKFGDFGQISKANKKEVLEMAKNLGILSKEELKSITSVDQLKKKLQEKEAQLRINNQTIEKTKQALALLGADRTQIDAYEKSLRELQKTAFKNKWTAEQLDAAIEKLSSETIAAASKKTTDWAATITNTANTMMQLSMAITSIQSLGRIFQDEDATFAEKFTQSLMAMSMILPLVGNGIAGVTAVQTIANKKLAGETVAVELNNLAKWKQTIVNKAVAASAGEATVSTLALGKAFLTTAGPILGLIAVFGIFFGIIDHFTSATEEASEKTKEAANKYEEIKNNVDELNSTLETAQNRIKELESQGTLTLVEEQELAKLKREVALLERKLKIEEERKKNAQKEQADTINDTFQTKADDIISHKPNGSSKYLRTADEVAEDLVNQGKYKTKQEAAVDPEVEKRLEAEKKLFEDYQEKNKSTLEELEEDYISYYEAMQSGAIAYDEQGLLNKIAALNEARKAMYESPSELFGEDQYFEIYIQPVFDSTEFDAIKGNIYDALKGDNGPEQALKYVSKDFEDLAKTFGLTVEDLLEILDNKVDTVQNKLNTLKVDLISGQNIEEEFAKVDALSAEDKEIFYSLNLENVENWNQAWALFEAAKQEKISLDLELSISEVNGALDLLNNGEELDEEAISSLENLKSKYSELAEIQDVSSHQYLTALQQIREQQEANALEALRQAREQQEIQRKGLKGEINLLKSVQENYEEGSQGWNEYELKIVAKTEELEEKLKEIQDTDYSIDMQINADLATDVEDAFGMAREFEKLKSYIADGLEITFDQAQSLIAAGYGEILQLSTETANSTILLNQEVANAFIDSKQAEIEADKESKIEQLEHQRQVLVTKQTLLTQEVSALETALGAEDATSAATALAKAQYLQAGVNAASEAANKEMAYAEDANLEISEDAERLSEFLGVTQTTNAENAQQASDDADTAYATMAGNAINYANQMQMAYVAVSNAVKASATGSAVYNPISFKGKSGGISVGATPAKTVDTKYDVTELVIDPEELSQKILEEANNNVEAIKAVAQQQLNSAKAELTTVNNQIGAIDAGIAALKSGSKSLDKMQLNPGGGKGGGGDSSKAAEDKSKEKERYHDINRQLEDQEQLLSEIEKQAERTYGLDRLKLYEKELEEINKQTAYEQIKLAEAGNYLQTDAKALESLNLNVQFKDNGEIANWNAIIDQTIAEYKAGIAGATEEEAKAVQEMYDKRIAAIEKYEESINTFQEQQEKVWDGLRKARDAELRNTTYKLDVLLNVKNMKDAAREFSQAVTESFSDSLYHGIDSAKLGAEGAKAEMALLGEYQQQQVDLQKLLDNADEFTSTEDIIAEMEELQGNVIASGEALLDWIETVETMLPEAIDAAREKFSLFTDQLDHNTSVLDTIKELLSLQGVTYKTSRGFNTLQEVSQEKLDAAVASAELQRGWMERARTELLEAQRALEQVEEGDAAYDTLKNNRDALLEEYNSAQAAMLESAQEAMEMAREMFLTEIEKASYDFSKAISDGLGLDLLQERYDHLIEEEERYLDEVNTTYEQLKWNSKLQTAIDEASSLASKNALKNLQEEFEQRKKNGEISQYDLDILNAKYEMTQKQIALEEAQNNKSQVRLVRNSQGNWDYQYTSDQNAIDDANQEYADAANEYYNIAKDQVKDVTEEIVATWQECNEKVKEVYEDETLTVAEREAKIAEIREFYSEKILYLEEQKNNALKDMTAAGGEIIGEYGNTYQDVIDLMQDGTADFNEAFNEYLDDMEDAWNDYDDTVGDVADSTGTEMGDLRDIIDEVSESTDDCREVGEELSEMMWDQMEDIRELSQDYADWADEIYGVVRALEALATAQGQAVEDASQESGTNRDTTASSGKGYNASIDYASIIGTGVQNGWLSSGEVSKLENERDAKIEGEELRDKYSSDVDWETIKVGSMTKEQWEKLLDKTVSLNTGGYTGDFSDSKLAFLHEKELVLNQTDTANILATVNMIRSIGPALLKQIETALDNNAIAGANLFNMKMGAAISADTTTQELLQTVHVTAEFPNATDQSEIREAILGLANYATQIVNPR